MKQKDWSKLEDEYLINNIEKLGYIKLADELDRTEISVKERAKSIRIKEKRKDINCRNEKIANIKISKYGIIKHKIQKSEVEKLAFSKPWI